MGLKIYTVNGLMDWQAEIKAGKARVTVHFTGGAMTAYGITPAEYSTRDPFVQAVIERSDYFKEGRIRLAREIKEARGERGSRAPEAGSQNRRITGSRAPEAGRQEGAAKAAAQNQASPSQEEQEDMIEQEEGIENGEAERVQVSCLTEAQNYLKEHFGIATSRSRSRERAHELALQNGVIFEGLG